MGGGLYSLDKKEYEKTLDLSRVKPYGDTLNDGKIQVSFTLPVPSGAKAQKAALIVAEKMQLEDAHIVLEQSLDSNFTYFVIYGDFRPTIDYSSIEAEEIASEFMSMKEIDAFIQEKLNRKVVVLGASTGTDAHTVGIDAIMNRKGFAGHYGLERYNMIEALNMGSQVTNEDFIRKAIDVKADVMLVSQTVTQKNMHVKNLIELVELLEAENLRDKVILICGGARIGPELAKELGYDAGFGPGFFAEHVATYFVKEIEERSLSQH